MAFWAGMLLLCAGCISQPWTFSHGEPLATSAAVDNLPVAGGGPAAASIPGSPGPAVVGPSYQPAPAAPAAVPDQRAAYPVAAASYAGPDVPTYRPPPGIGPAPNIQNAPPGIGAGSSMQNAPPGGSPVPPGTVAFEPMPADVNWLGAPPPDMLSPQPLAPGTIWQPPPGWDTAPIAAGGNPPCQPPVREPMLLAMWDREVPSIRCDFANYYSWPTAIEMAAGFGVGAVLANTDLDSKFTDWYQTRVRSKDSTYAANYIRPFGEGQYTIPVAVSLALLNDTGWLDDSPTWSTVGQWGDRVARAYLVGGPPMLAMQYITGGSRPDFADAHSSWRPFSASNGVSGDAFMSSCMFISAADMSDQLAWKGFFYACSFIVPWERVNNNDHYLSQAALGWWMGYVACQAVNNTELSKRNVMIVPLVGPEMTGVGVVFQH